MKQPHPSANTRKLHDFMLTNRHLHDLNPILMGYENCEPGHSFGPHVRKYTLIHYVVKGSGMLYARGGQHPVHAGQAFLILPEEVTTYVADLQDPWEYQWVGFDGALSSKFANLPPVLTLSDDIFPALMRSGYAEGAEYRIASVLLRLYAELFSGKSSGNQHVRKVESYIQTRFMQQITVEKIAELLNLDRRYLTRLFKEKTGQTIQEYLIATRLKEACEYLQKGYSVHDAAFLCGYEDVSNFSRMFKNQFGLSPKHWAEYAKSAH